MKRVSTIALGLALGLGTVVGVTTPASAQEAGVEFDPGNMTNSVRQVAGTAQQAMAGESPDLAAIQGQLASAAQAAVNGDDKFFVGSLLLQLSVAMQNGGADAAQVQPIQRQGLQLAVESGRLSQEDAGRYWTFLGNMANAEDDYPQAISAYQNALRFNPNNPDANIQMALAQFNSGNSAAGYESADRALDLMAASGQPIPANWITVPLNEASRGGDAPRVLLYGARLIETEPTPNILRQVLLAYSTASRFDDQANLDMFRLMAAANAHDGSTSSEYATLAAQRGLPGEAQSAYNNGVSSSGMAPDAAMLAEIQDDISGDRSSLGESEAAASRAATGVVAMNTADAYRSYGELDKAITLYRMALDKGGVDAGTANLRMAVALYEAGRVDEARTALQAVSGAREGLAAFWLAWLDQEAGGAEAVPSAE